MSIDRERVLQAAQKFVEKKKYDRAVLEYQKIISEDPNDARTLLKIGDLQLKMEAYAEAISTYERVGRFYAAQGFALKAIAVYKQIREIINKHIPTLMERYGHVSPKLAELYQQLGLTSDALAALDEHATRLQRQQRDSEAIEVFRKIVELDPTNPLPHLRLAEALSRSRDNDGAATEFGIAASQLVKHGRRDDALKVIERLLHHRQDVSQARIAAELYLARNQPSDGMQALAKLQICFQSNPKDLDTLALLARAFVAIGQASKGIEVHKEMARIARDQGKVELFRELVAKLEKIAPNDEAVRQLAATASGAEPQAPAPPKAPPPPVASEPAPVQRAAPPAPPTPPPAGRRPPPPPPPRTSPTIAATPERRRGDSELTSADDLVEEMETAPGDDLDVVRREDPMFSRTDQSPAQASAESGGNTLDDSSEDDVPEMLVDEAEGLELVDEDAAALEAQEQIAVLLDEAAAQREGGQLADAIETLRAAIEIDPRNIDVRLALRDVLLDAGRTDEAVDEMLTVASLQLDALDGDGAARSLEDVLTYDPGNERALATLRELGYDVDAYVASQEAQAAQAAQEAQDAQDAQDLANQEQFLPPAEPPPASSSSAYDEPLPSYDLEEIGPADTSDAYGAARELAYDSHESLPSAYEPPPEPMHDTSSNLHQVDDPFGDQPLPSFPVDAPESDAAFDLVQAGGGPAVSGHGRSARHLDDLDADLPGEEPEGERTRSVSRAEIETNVASTRPTAELEEALEEAEFFASRGLYDDARAVLSEQLSRLPNNPLLRERMHELDMQEQAAAQTSGTRQLPQGSDDRSFDIAASLDALESLDESSQPAEGNALVDGQIDVEEVFAKFKEGVSKQISIDDGQSHYDLGLAYKEMGLIDDAIREFEVAARDYKRACICESMIGLIHMERGNSNDAIDAFLRGLHAQVRTAEQETVLSFELGQAYEAKKMFKDAVQYYQRVARREPNYRDVQERLRRLGKNEPAPMRAAAGADDEFDRAFDEIIGSGKLP
ncbi:MAG: hypothetical protein JWM74_2395 [Myxococcaceae bacterium]|nr:hypothetical protein [Myxococcaceae bacterium]